MGDLLGVIFILVLVFVAAIALSWVRAIRLNSKKQLTQNQEIIALLKKSAKENSQ